MTARVDVLGPLRLVVDGSGVDLRGQKRRAVLAMLALAEGRTVPVDRLVDALWPAEAPESGRQALHSHVFRLRGQLGSASRRLETRPDGYRLDLGPDGLDAARARRLLAAARGGKGTGEGTREALAAARAAHALWRGPVLADLLDVPPIANVVQTYEQLRREVTDAVIACALAAGEADSVVGQAAESLAADPLREPAALLLMRALAATGRPSEALRVGREYRERLAEEVGLDPSPALDELVREIASGPVGRAPQVPTRPATRLFGRDADLAELRRLLASERLVTLVGPGGVGKTRVALELPAATVLRLAPLTDPATIPHALAAALGLTVARGDVLPSCLAVLADRPGLLVVDNCEHLVDAVRDLVSLLLAACPALTVLATSREPLGLGAEYVHRLAPLPHRGAVEVFRDRAGRVRPGSDLDPGLVTDIVRRLDGIPLAIELAAGRLSTFALHDLHQRLDRSLDLLAGRPSGEARHGTLRATVEWSYRLLSAEEQRLFRHLAIFVDGVPLDAAERLAAALGLTGDPGTLLARLVDASMLEADFTTGTRYRMLETLRAYGLDRLEAAGETDGAARHLVDWAVDLTAWVEVTMTTAREPDADATLRRELPNLRAAWRHARDRKLLDAAAAIVSSQMDAVGYRDLIEIRDWAEELGADPALDGHPLAAAVLGVAAEAAYHRGDYPFAEYLCRRGLALGGSWHCLTTLANADLARGGWDDAIEHSLAAARLATVPRENLGLAALATAYAGRLDEARALNERGRAGATSPTMRGWGAYVAGEIDSAAGRHTVAEVHYQQAVDLARGSGATFLVGVATVGLLSVRARAGRFRDALRGYREVIDYFERTGNWTHLWTTLRNLAAVLRELGDDGPAGALTDAADRAPDAPAVGGAAVPPLPAAGPGRAAVLTLARAAIDRNIR